jgi:hypothetical protein
MAGSDREGRAHDGEPRDHDGAVGPDDPARDRPCPSVPAGVLVLELRGWHPAFGAPPGPESPRVPSFAEIAAIRFAARMRAEAGADCVPGLRCDEPGRRADLDTSGAGHAEAHRPRPSRPWLQTGPQGAQASPRGPAGALGAHGSQAVPGPARSAGADELSATQRAQRRRGATQTGWLEGSGLEAGERVLEPSRALSGDVGGLAFAVLAAAGLLWCSLMAWAWWG